MILKASASMFMEKRQSGSSEPGKVEMTILTPVIIVAEMNAGGHTSIKREI